MSALSTRVAAVAEAEPERPALAEGPRRASYGELWDDVRRFAAALGARGVRPGDRVALLLPNCIEAVVACYGTWLAGAVVVPLNVHARARDFGRWLSHCEARFVVRSAENADLDEALSSLASPPESIVWTYSGRGVATPPLVATAPTERHHELAMVLYTSGTTGEPKGVMLSHANLHANTSAIVEYLGLTGADSVVSVLPFYYSYGASVLHTHLSVGARVVLEPNLVFPNLVAEAIARERATGFSGVPSTFALLLARVNLASYDLSSLRYLTQAGGPMPPALVQRLRAALPGTRLFLMYGQTEATARLTWLPPERIEEKIGSVGLPISGTRLEVRRDTGEAARPGEIGEVWVTGAHVMLGFLKDPVASSAVIREGWLKTGDMGRLDDEGFLYLAGRRSDMIKIGAHRVHPSDIEQVIGEVCGVAEVAVIGIDDEVLGQRVKAFVVADGERVPERIRAHCRACLAAYKIPKQIELVASLPKTASGKVQRARLIARESTPPEAP
jgi:long-chain acyl-CoA synthetase